MVVVVPNTEKHEAHQKSKSSAEAEQKQTQTTTIITTTTTKKSRFMKLRSFPEDVITVRHSGGVLYLVSSKAALYKKKNMFNSQTPNWEIDNLKKLKTINMFMRQVAKELNTTEEIVGLIVYPIFAKQFQNTFQANLFVQRPKVAERFAHDLKTDKCIGSIRAWIKEQSLSYQEQLKNAYSIDYLISKVNQLALVYKRKNAAMHKKHMKWYKGFIELQNKIVRLRLSYADQSWNKKFVITTIWESELMFNRKLEYNQWCEEKWAGMSPELILDELRIALIKSTLRDVVASTLKETNEKEVAFLEVLGRGEGFDVMIVVVLFIVSNCPLCTIVDADVVRLSV